MSRLVTRPFGLALLALTLACGPAPTPAPTGTATPAATTPAAPATPAAGAPTAPSPGAVLEGRLPPKEFEVLIGQPDRPEHWRATVRFEPAYRVDGDRLLLNWGFNQGISVVKVDHEPPKETDLGAGQIVAVREWKGDGAALKVTRTDVEFDTGPVSVSGVSGTGEGLGVGVAIPKSAKRIVAISLAVEDPFAAFEKTTLRWEPDLSLR